jgi:carboxymethylenebutenolidase
MSDAIRAETITIASHDGDEIEAYQAIPLDERQYGGVVVIHHMPGYDRATKEIVRTFAVYGYNAVCPNLFHRYAPGTKAAAAAAAAREVGGVPDAQCVGDVAGAAEHLRSLPTANGKIGVIGYCSGGRQAFLVACTLLWRSRRGRARRPVTGPPGGADRSDAETQLPAPGPVRCRRPQSVA